MILFYCNLDTINILFRFVGFFYSLFFNFFLTLFVDIFIRALTFLSRQRL